MAPLPIHQGPAAFRLPHLWGETIILGAKLVFIHLLHILGNRVFLGKAVPLLVEQTSQKPHRALLHIAHWLGPTHMANEYIPREAGICSLLYGQQCVH